MFKIIKRYYDKGTYTAEDVAVFVKAKKKEDVQMHILFFFILLQTIQQIQLTIVHQLDNQFSE